MIRFYREYLQDTYGCRVQKITVDAGFTCPNRDGSKGFGGCTYCNNDSFSPSGRRQISIEEQVIKAIARQKIKRPNVNKFFVYFQNYSNTYADLEKLKILYQAALVSSEVIGLCIGTRPDCLSEELLNYLEVLGERLDITIELGLESIDDETLKKINRCHSVKDFKDAVAKINDRKNILLCVHLILGFPWEKTSVAIESAKFLNKVGKIDFVKLHQLHIVKETIMEKEHLKKPYQLWTKQEYLNAVVDFLRSLDPAIIIQRLSAQSPKEMTIAPDWSLSASEFKDLVLNEMKTRGYCQGQLLR